MKKLGLLGCILGLFLGFSMQVHADEPGGIQGDIMPDHALCKYEPPPSCFFALPPSSDPNAVAEGQKGGWRTGAGTRPNHCPTSGLQGLSDDSVMEVMYNHFDIGKSGSPTSTQKMDLLQERLITECNPHKPNSTCDPVGDSIMEGSSVKEGPTNLDQLAVTCKPLHLSDGKYGICTREAIIRYLRWYRANHITCDKQPQLVITAPKTVMQGEEFDATVSQEKDFGYAWNWEEGKEPEFMIKKYTELTVKEPELKLIDCPPLEKNLPETVEIDKPEKLQFNSTGVCNMTAINNIVEQKIKLKPLKTQEPVKVIIQSETKIINDNIVDKGERLTCKQLLPRYLVGAGCEEELYGDARDITYWLQRFSGQITTFLAALAVLLIAWNAFGLVMAAGDSDKIATGKKALMWTGVGLLLAIFAYVIVKTAISLTFLQ